MIETYFRLFVGLAVLALSACSSGGNGVIDGGDGFDAGDGVDAGDGFDGGDLVDAGDEFDGGDALDAGDRDEPQECAFPFTPLREHTFHDPYGGEITLWDRHILCAIEYEDLHAKVLLKAVPTGVNFIGDPEYEADEAHLCRDGQVEPLDGGAFYYQAYHHGWDEMGVAVDELKYIFAYADWCIGGRPCNPTFEIFDVRLISDDTLVAGKQLATCARTTQAGIPKPLVPRVRVPEEGVDIVFDMGSEAGADDESPVHEVMVRPLRIDVREATNRDFALFLNDHGNDCDGHACINAQGEGIRLHMDGDVWKPDPGFGDHPVVWVSWYGADTYCKWRSYLLLPNEAQWEMVASVAGTQAYPWGGQSPTCELALFDECGADAPEAACSRRAGNSPGGVCDFSGNVAEWVSDWYQADYYSTCVEECRYPRGPIGDTGAKVIRGGSFADPAANLRATDRDFADPESFFNRVGVRCRGGAGEPK